MKKNLLILALVLASAGLHAQIFRAMAPRFSATSERGNIIYVANNSIYSQSQSTSEAPPGGTGVNNSNLPVQIDIDGVQPDTLIRWGTAWKYLANNTRPAGWETSGYNDAAWITSNAHFGFGDGDEITCLPYGCGGNVCNPGSGCGPKYISYYFRRSISISNIASFSNFTLNVRRDDGVVVYVNGTEVYRNNMPGGAVVHATLASSAASDDGNTPQTATIPASSFTTGTNVVAVEIHQNSNTSSDLSFDLELVGNPNTKTTLLGFGGSWKYLDNNTRPANWETVAYNDAAWASGNAELGYGDGGEATVVSYGPDANNKYITTYFRRVVNISNPSQYANIIFNIIRDDGVVVYVNGTEAFRNNMPTGAIAHGTLATANVGGTDETTPQQYTLPTSLFVNGNNTIAVEMHQDAVTSSDLSFNLQILGNTDSTFNSSSADLSLASCSEILFAGLYWGASLGGTNNTSWRTAYKDTVYFKVPGASNYIKVTATQKDLHNYGVPDAGQNHDGYTNFADVTSLLNATSPNGTYTVANVIAPTSWNNCAAGWSLVIAYKNSSEILRNLVVFDGNVQVGGNGATTLEVPFGGFITPYAGPVTCQLGAVCYDGDRTSSDGFYFKQDSTAGVGTYTDLTLAPAPNTSGAQDAWNSTISHLGNNVTTRMPAHMNTHGFDADIVEVPNVGNLVLGNSVTSARIRLQSSGEKYFLQVLTTATSVREPFIRINKTSTDVNGGSLLGNEELLYTIAYNNTGNDSSLASYIIDTIPVGATYVPGSLRINGVSRSDASADDQAEFDVTNNRVVFRIGNGANATTGGRLLPGANGTVEFRVYTPNICRVRTCTSTLTNMAFITYTGATSGNIFDHGSVRLIAGCLTEGSVSDLVTGTCRSAKDTILTNICPSTSVTIPIRQYIGYNYYTALPFTPATLYNPATPVTTTRILYGWYNGPGICDDTVQLNIYISPCPDIDDDNDGIPDYVELDNSTAWGNHDGDANLNWNDPQYPGFIDNDGDSFNDNFDPSADSDNDGIPNFIDPSFAGYVDSNGDGVNDNMDKDLDGLPNHLDLDSDNDGIPDTAESFGVDANGDGRIDNYTDTDNDGFSQNVDANNTGVTNSALGLGPLDTDADGIPNYLDLDSDNDGIPDIIEVFGTDVSNSAKVDVFGDTDADGYADALDGDVGNDNVAENSAAALLRTSADGNSDGRTDTWPFKNMEGDSKPNPYDLDSDGDGIADVREAQFTDAGWDGQVDGPVNTNGRNTSLAGLPSISIPNTDGVGRTNPYDIDSDEDGIPDNVEGMTTLGYLLPANADTDGDGIDNRYDNFNGFGGDGIHPCDIDGDTTPDYLDSDTDADGRIDRIEGNDLNLNGQADDNITLTGVDTDGDGLDNRFDANNSSVEATSARMGDGGTISGDPTPGSITTVQHTTVAHGCPTERDWRCLPYVLSCEFITVRAVLNNDQTTVQWEALCRQEVDYFVVERSIDRTNFVAIGTVLAKPVLNEVNQYNTLDNIAGVNEEVLFYRIKAVAKSGRINYSAIVLVRKQSNGLQIVQVMPNPALDYVQLLIKTKLGAKVSVHITDAAGSSLYRFSEKLLAGNNSLTYRQVAALPSGTYYIRVFNDELNETVRFHVIK